MEEKTQEIATKTYDGFSIREGEYIKGDMIYCSNCGGKKLFVPSEKHAINGIIPRRVRMLCHCESKAIADKEKQEKDQLRLEYFKKLQEASLLGERYKDVTFDNTIIDKDTDESFVNAFNRCKKYCENNEECYKNSYGIYMFGDYGSGKTHLLACMVNYLSKELKPCLITNFYEITKNLAKGDKAEFAKKIVSIPFLFIDDFGTENVLFNGKDNGMQEKIYDLINLRYNNKKPTIFSSNLSLKELVNEKGLMKKTVDRVAEMATAVMKINTKLSYRLRNRQKDLPF